MKVIVVKDYQELSKTAAGIFAQDIKAKPDIRLGLATGSTPIGMYKELIDMYKNGDVDFSKVYTFNLDEYYPIEPSNDQSYIYFMKNNLFNHININMENVHIPNGLAEDIDTECKNYDKTIEDFGGIDIQLLGVGRNGHIGFNEPADEIVAGTHQTSLDEDTIEANARFFNSKDDVPIKAITMGVGPILKAKKIVVLMSGANKNPAFKKLTSGVVTTKCPVTLLNLHNDAIVIADEAAATGK